MQLQRSRWIAGRVAIRGTLSTSDLERSALNGCIRKPAVNDKAPRQHIAKDAKSRVCYRLVARLSDCLERLIVEEKTPPAEVSISAAEVTIIGMLGSGEPGSLVGTSSARARS